MSSLDDKLELDGIVTQKMPGAQFDVTCKQGNNSIVVKCSLSGKIRQNKILISVGDKVRINVSVYDVRRGIIVWRYT